MAETTTLKSPSRTKYIVATAMLVLCGVIILGITGFAWPKTIHIEDNGKVLTVSTQKERVEEVLSEAGVQLGTDDRVTPKLQSELADKMKIKIVRAFEVSVAADGEVSKVNLVGGTVQEVLNKAQVALNPADKVSPALDEAVTKGVTINVTRVTEKTEKVNYSIPFTTERRRDHNITRGITKVVQEGKAGMGQRVIKTIYENGKELKRELIENVVLQKPVQKVVAVGTLSVVSRGGKELRYDRSLVMNASGYTHTGNRTATGIYPRRGIVAVDPSVIPFGTKLYIDGYGYATAADRGSAIRGNKIDLFYETEREAYNWGRRNVRVYIVQP